MKLSLILKNSCSWFIHQLLPVHCVLCQRSGAVLCNDCYQLIHFLPTTPLELRISPNNRHIDQARVMAVYQPPISTLIKTLKYQRVKAIAPFLAWLLYMHLSLPRCSLITWVPANPIKVGERGFNQAQLIGEHLATLLNLPALALLKKIKHTAAQAKSSWTQRLTTQENSFQLDQKWLKASHSTSVNSALLAQYQASDIIIIDDVITTGATLNECAKTLHLAGFSGKIYGVGVARSSK